MIGRSVLWAAAADARCRAVLESENRIERIPAYVPVGAGAGMDSANGEYHK
jgi:hypothetical protein